MEDIHYLCGSVTTKNHIMKFFNALSLSLILFSLAGCAQKPEVTANYQVIPLPQEIAVDSVAKGFVFDKSTAIAYASDDASMQKNAELLASYLAETTGITPAIKPDASKNAIILTDTLSNPNSEAYNITVNSDRIVIDGASSAGTFYGIQTIRKSVAAADSLKQGAVLFPAAEIYDAPRFAYRGGHFDTARHFFTPDSVKIFIDMLAMHNINKFHWHITDDQGWRLEIKSRPELTEKGSIRKGTMIGQNFSTNDSIPYGGFYTQDEVRDIVQYAADRHITIIPEIDLPGHMLAALAAYPELGCTGGPYDVWGKWGVSEDVLCAGNDSVYAFLDDVLGEVVDLFPSEYIHIGGDECPKARWSKCPKCQAKIKELGLKSDSHSTAEQKLQTHVMAHASDFLAQHGRKVIGWDEILEGGAPDGSIIMSWRGIDGAREAAKAGHDAIMTPCQYLYFDFRQSDDPSEPIAATWGDIIIPETVYGFDPIPADLTPEETKHILGVQANLWTEYIPNFRQAEYMLVPRLAALAEVQWSSAPKDFEAFKNRLPGITRLYDLNGYNRSKHVSFAD